MKRCVFCRRVGTRGFKVVGWLDVFATQPGSVACTNQEACRRGQERDGITVKVKA